MPDRATFAIALLQSAQGYAPYSFAHRAVASDQSPDNLNILIGSTYEQGFIRFGRFFKVYVQSLPEYRRLP